MSKFHCWLSAVERLVLTLWVGGACGVAYVAVPTLFASLDKQAAGALAAPMFKIVGVIGIVAVALLLALRAGRGVLQNWRTIVLIVAGVGVAVGLFILQPQMAALKAEGLIAGSDQARRFGMLHGISSALYMATTVLGLGLVVAGSGNRCGQRGNV